MNRKDVGVMLPYPHREHRLRLLEGLKTCAWAADNGCFTSKGKFDISTYLEWLKSLEEVRESCQFVTAPDVLEDAEATWARSIEVMPQLRQAGWPVAYVLQDGATSAPWNLFDVAFIGGSTEFKLGVTARNLALEAKERGLRVHMGRVNSYKRLKYANDIGCDTVDGTFLKFGPTKNVPRLEGWLTKLYQATSSIGGEMVSVPSVGLVGAETVLGEVRNDT